MKESSVESEPNGLDRNLYVLWCPGSRSTGVYASTESEGVFSPLSNSKPREMGTGDAANSPLPCARYSPTV
jgi:hypothetical protein